MAQVCDALIIGGGHNGLVCAAYLGGAGLKVTVLERRHLVGGAAVTEEFHPGFRNSVASYTVSLLNEKISQGQPDGWPAYRIEWQSLASLQRRLRACFYGVRAEQPAFGDPDLIALELYLAARAKGLPVTVPGVRR